jgi:hypothetical protein
MPRLCPWSLDSMEYRGYCGRLSVNEYIHGYHENLSPEQIEALDAKNQLKNSRRDALKRGKEDKARGEVLRIKNNRASEKYRCDLCDVVFGPALGCGDTIVPRSTSTMLPGSPKLSNTPETEETAAKILKPGDTTASPATTLPSQQNLTRHFQSSKHLKKMAAESGT